MSHKPFAVLTLFCATLFGAFAGAATPLPPAGGYAPGHLLVKFDPTASAGDINAAEYAVGAYRLKHFDFIGWDLLQLPAAADVPAAVSQIKAFKAVTDASADYTRTISGIPNDPLYGQLYGMTKIGAPTAWDSTVGSANVVVGVVDTGVFYNHEDLAANMWRNPGETGLDVNGHDKATNGIDDDNDGYVDDVYGIDAGNGDSDPNDDFGHGTHCAGTIGGVGNNGKGVAGVNWTVKIMALKFLKPTTDAQGNPTASGSDSDAITCYQYAVYQKNHGVNIRVLSNSWGGGPNDGALKAAIDTAGNANIISVCAAGNDSNNSDVNPEFPGAFNSASIVSVGASDSNDNPASFSNYGATSVDLFAPGVNIISTLPTSGAALASGSGYGSLSGTSMATPHVAGAAALLVAQIPTLTVAQIKSALLSSVDVKTSLNGLCVTGGRLNVGKAMISVVGSSNLHLVITAQPSSGQSHVPFATQPVVVVQDASNHTATSFNGTVSIGIKPGTGTAGAVLNTGSTASATAVNGVATFSGLYIDRPGTGYVLEATNAFTAPVDSNPFNVITIPTKLGFQLQPSDGLVNTPLTQQPILLVQDAYNFTVTDYSGSVSIALTPGTGTAGATLGGTTTVPVVNGVATFTNLQIDKPGTGYTVTATSGSLTSAVSGPIRISPKATHIVFGVQPGGGSAGSVLSRQPVIRAVDDAGNLADSFSGSVTVSLKAGTGASGATLSGTTTVSISGGVGTFAGLGVDKPGSGYVLTAVSGSFASVDSAPFNVGGTATKLIFTTQPVGGKRGDILTVQPVVQAVDANNNPAPGFTGEVTLGIESGTSAPGSSIGGTAVINAVSGVATFTDISVDHAGSGFVLTATADGLTGAESAPFTVLPAITYVSTSGSDANDGHSWNTAMRTIQTAVNGLVAGDEVWVGAGRYTENVQIYGDAGLYGGFAGTETQRSQRNTTANVTTLDGGHADCVLTLGGGLTPATVIDGFTITNGGGFLGGAISFSGSSPTVTNNIITGNEGGDAGGGIFCDQSTALIANNVFSHNHATQGGGIYLSSGNPTVLNNTFADNTASDGGGIFFADSQAILANNAVAYNSSGIYLDPNSSSPPTLTNNGVSSNTAYNLSSPLPAGSLGDISTAPGFVNHAAGDYHLAAGSSFINAGDDASAAPLATDLDGHARIQGTHVDIGAYESSVVASPFTLADAIAALKAAGGLATASTADAARLNVATASPSATTVDVLDAVRIVRKAAGVDSNP